MITFRRSSSRPGPWNRRARPPRLPAVGLLLLLILASCRSAGGPSSPARIGLPTEGALRLPTSVCGDYFVAEILINGTGPWPVLLDSGAGRTLLDPEVIQVADLGAAIDSLQIGEFRAYEVGFEPLVMEELSVALGVPVHGILGHPVFARTLVTYDYLDREVVIERGALPIQDPSVVATRDRARPFVEGTVGGTTRWILLDTGSSRGFTLRDPERLPLSSPLTTTGARVRVDGVHLVRSGRVQGEARLGPVRVDAPVVSNSVSVDLVGQEVLRHFRITFDQVNDRVRFERADTAADLPIPSLAVHSNGFAVQPYSTHGEVIHVWDPAVPVQQGDRVIATGGRPWTERSCRPSRVGPLPDPVPDSVDLTLVRGGDTLTVRSPRTVVHPRPPR